MKKLFNVFFYLKGLNSADGEADTFRSVLGGTCRAGCYALTRPIQTCRCHAVTSDVTPVIRGRRHSDGRDAYRKTRARKTVRFADDMGLTLVQIRHYVISDEDGFKWACSVTSPFDDDNVWEDEIKKSQTPLVIGFSQPGVEADFPLRVKQQSVCLENCITDNNARTITGVVRVANKGFSKRVTARVSTNNWVTFEDTEARYVPNSSDGLTDRFLLTITVPWFMAKGGRVDFALRYICGDQTYWDNNRDKNYTIYC